MGAFILPGKGGRIDAAGKGGRIDAAGQPADFI